MHVSSLATLLPREWRWWNEYQSPLRFMCDVTSTFCHSNPSYGDDTLYFRPRTFFLLLFELKISLVWYSTVYSLATVILLRCNTHCMDALWLRSLNIFGTCSFNDFHACRVTALSRTTTNNKTLRMFECRTACDGTSHQFKQTIGVNSLVLIASNMPAFSSSSTFRFCSYTLTQFGFDRSCEVVALVDAT